MRPFQYIPGYFVETRPQSIPGGYAWGLYFILAPKSSREIAIAWKMSTVFHSVEKNSSHFLLFLKIGSSRLITVFKNQTRQNWGEVQKKFMLAWVSARGV
jgi:hypothetical protein